MPAPLVIGAVAAASALFGSVAAVGARATGKAYLTRTLNAHRPAIEKWALSAVFEKMGLPDLMEGGSLNQGAFTDAINERILGASGSSGFKFTNLFDRDAIRRDAFKFGVKQAAKESGLKIEDVSEQGLKDALKARMVELVEAELTAEDVGELTRDAKDVWEIIQLYKAYRKAAADGEAAENGGRKPLINTPEAVKNRARQAKFRQGHKKKWVAK